MSAVTVVPGVVGASVQPAFCTFDCTTKRDAANPPTPCSASLQLATVAPTERPRATPAASTARARTDLLGRGAAGDGGDACVPTLTSNPLSRYGCETAANSQVAVAV